MGLDKINRPCRTNVLNYFAIKAKLCVQQKVSVDIFVCRKFILSISLEKQTFEYCNRVVLQFMLLVI